MLRHRRAQLGQLLREADEVVVLRLLLRRAEVGVVEVLLPPRLVAARSPAASPAGSARSRRPSTRAGSRAARSARSSPGRRSAARARRSSGTPPCALSESTPCRVYTAHPMRDDTTIVVLEGDETGQELLEEALRVLAPDVIGARARAPPLRPLAREPARDAEPGRPRGCGRDPRARARPQGGDRHARGPRRRRLAEPDPPRGDRRQGDRPHRPAHPRRRRRSAASTRRSRSCAWRSATPTARRSGAKARATTRSRSAPSASSGASATPSPSSRSGRPSAPARRSSAGRSTRSARRTRGCSRRRWTPPRRVIPTCRTSRS